MKTGPGINSVSKKIPLSVPVKWIIRENMDVPELFCSLWTLSLCCRSLPLSNRNKHGSMVCSAERLIMRTPPECVQKPRSDLSCGSFWAKWCLECRTPWRSTCEKTAEPEVDRGHALCSLCLFKTCLHCWHSYNLDHTRGHCFYY